MKDADRYWFHREFCDLRHGRTRIVLVAVEKAGWHGPSLISGLPWNVLVEDRGVKQAWKLILMKMNGEDRLVFERYSKTSEGVKGETFELAYLPNWIIEELRQVALEMKERDMDQSSLIFLTNLVT